MVFYDRWQRVSVKLKWYFFNDFFHNASMFRVIKSQMKNVQRNKNVIRNLFTQLNRHMPQYHTNQNIILIRGAVAKGWGEMRAIAIKEAIPMYQESFENYLAEKLSRPRSLKNIVKTSKKSLIIFQISFINIY